MILTYGRTLNERFNVIGRILRMGNHAVHPSSNCASIIALHSHLFSLSAIYCVCFAYEDLHLLFFKSLLLRDYPNYIKVKLAPQVFYIMALFNVMMSVSYTVFNFNERLLRRV